MKRKNESNCVRTPRSTNWIGPWYSDLGIIKDQDEIGIEVSEFYSYWKSSELFHSLAGGHLDISLKKAAVLSCDILSISMFITTTSSHSWLNSPYRWFSINPTICRLCKTSGVSYVTLSKKFVVRTHNSESWWYSHPWFKVTTHFVSVHPW